MAEFEPKGPEEGLEKESATIEELAQMIETGKGEIAVTSDMLYELASDENTSKDLATIFRSAAEQIEKRDRWGKDTLTGLMAESRLNDSLEQAFENSRQEGEKLSIVLYDLDRLKEANNAGDGHAGGDKLVIAMAEALKEAYDPKMGLGRWRRGDEFAAVVRGDRKTAEKSDAIFQERLKGTNIVIAGKEIPISATGIIFELDPQKNLREQLERASKELIRFKEEKKGQDQDKDDGNALAA